jgi:hypothetical protein
MTRRRNVFRGLLAMIAIALLAVPVALAAPNGPSADQRVDMKVLLISPAATDSVYTAWQQSLTKLGIPYDNYVTGVNAQLTDATLADYASNRSRYQAVIFASGAVSLTSAERASLDKLETTFGVREISDNTNPDSAHGATLISGANTTATPNLTGTLTDAGKAVFPYLKGNVPLGGPAFAASGTPGPSFTSLVNAPGGGSYMGVWQRPNGTEQLVDGIPGNGAQSHFQLLRFGMLNWATRGAYLGYWRNYFEMQVDDLFLGDDAWDPATHSNNYDPAVASRMTPTDVAKALSWSRANNFRFDIAFNSGGHDLYLADGHASDPLWDAFKNTADYRSGFGWINHTYDHPFLGCSSANYISWEITKNVQNGQAIGLPLDPKELVTGEHSGLANTRPGNPGVLDPPEFDTLDAATTTGATLAPGTYYYAVTVSNNHGQTPTPAPVDVTVATGQNSVTANVSMICKGTTYSLYRGTSATGPWTLAAQKTQSGDTQTDNGVAGNPAATPVTLTDTGATVASPAANTAAAPPTTANTAVMDPYPMNKNFTTGLANAGVEVTATDSSKTYPVETSPTVPAAITGTQNPAGSVFNLPAPGGKVIGAVPRYPTNVYYNVSKQGQQLDEYNWIYTKDNTGTTGAEGGCVDIPDVTTCRTAAVTWAEYLSSELGIVFGHITGNDPRPHFAHQSNFADYNAALPETDPNQGGILYPYLDNILTYYHGLYADNAPIVQSTSTEINQALNRQRDWAANVAAGKVSGYIQGDKMHIVTTAAMQVPVTGTTQGETYGATKSMWLGVNAGETVLDLKDPIAVAGSSSPGPSAPAPTPASAPKSGVKGATVKPAARPSLTGLSMSSRKFAAARKGLAKSRSRTQFSWKLNRAASVRLVIQRKLATRGKKTSWLTMGTITKNAKAGTTKVTFTGKLGSRKVSRGSYRVLATATAGSQSSKAKALTFSVIKR